MALLARVESRHVARQHAAVGRLHVARDESHLHARDGVHAQHPEHVHVGVAAAEQHQVLDHHAILAHPGARLPARLPHGVDHMLEVSRWVAVAAPQARARTTSELGTTLAAALERLVLCWHVGLSLASCLASTHLR